MADWNKYILNRLFIAVPELQIDKAFLTLLHRSGLASEADMAIAESVRQKSKKYAKIASAMRGKSLIQRIMTVAPEIMSVTTIDFLRKFDLVDATLGNALRVGLKAGKAILPGSISQGVEMERWAAGGKALMSFDTINLLRNLDEARIRELAKNLPDTEENRAALKEALRLSILRGQRARSLLSAGRLSAETLAAIDKAHNIWGILTLVAEGVLSDRLLRDAIRAGVISQERYELISALSKLGLNVWKKLAKGLADHDAVHARMLLMSEGLLSPEMIKALIAAGIIPPEMGAILYPSATAIRAITRSKLQQYMKGIRIHVVPGEAPIKTYARITGATDREILKLLAQAAKEARKEAERLAAKEGFGNLTRAAQQRLIQAEMNKQMRNLWEGIGHLAIFGEKEASRAAAAGEDFLQNNLWARVGKEGADFRRIIQRETEAGIDAYISRQENLLKLSKLVYGNKNVADGLVARRINLGLLRGLSAKELAADIQGLISPGVKGGVSYNAMRLARTEINNAFHNSAIRSTRDMPWVTGYRWNLSGSHPHIDVCNDYAQGNHDGIGRGVYKKANVPQKPHPNCFCYITSVTADAGTFERQFANGSYANYLKETQKAGAFPESDSWHSAYDEQAKTIAGYAKTALGAYLLKQYGPKAITSIVSSL